MLRVAGRSRAWILMVCLVAPLTARAESTDAEARARLHYETGQGLFRLGDYSDAIREFAAGYHLVPKPEFLLNIAQAYRRLDQAKALDMFRRFLTEAPADHPNRKEVQDIVDRIVAELDRPPKETIKPLLLSAEPAPPAPSAVAASTVAAPAPKLVDEPLVAQGESPPRARPSWRRPLLLVLAATAGVALVAGVTLGAVLGSQPRAPEPTAGTVLVTY